MRIQPLRDLSKLNGTGLMGYLRTTRHDLETLFGPPNVCSETLGKSGDDKVTTEWALEIEENGRKLVFTLYDYKEERAPAPDEVFDWHIGGHTHDVLSLLLQAHPILDVRSF